MCHMYIIITDFAYDGPIFLIPLSLSYPSLPVYVTVFVQFKSLLLFILESIISFKALPHRQHSNHLLTPIKMEISIDDLPSSVKPHQEFSLGRWILY